MFSQEFKDINPEKILTDIKNKGYFSFDNALSTEFINNILSDVNKEGVNLNTNNISGVYYSPGSQFFLTHMMAVSKNFYNFCTNSILINICSNFFKDAFRIKAFRYYENFGGQKMQWHTDNKSEAGKNDTKGLIFIVYLSDVQDGEFQYIEGSHIWSANDDHTDYNNDLIEEKYKDKIVSFKKNAGGIIIYNTYGIHRAKPTKNSNFVRKSLFLQIDENLNIATPIYIKTEFLDNLNDKLKTYLGFGLRANQNNYPPSNMDTLPLNKKILIIMINWILKKILNNIIRYLPGFIRKRLRKLKITKSKLKQ